MTKVVTILLCSCYLIHADNTPDLCTSDIVDLLKIKPSDTNPGVPVPNITVGGFEYNGDAEHFVIGNSISATKDLALVYIPGTTDRPALSSCLLKSVAEHAQYPTIGLSYKYLSSGDKFRNGKCALLGSVEEQVNCLTEQHEDAINGGTFGSTHFKDDGSHFWDEILPHDSITARLGFLFKYLDDSFPNSGWELFYSNGSEFPVPNWKKLIIMGHSQGAGHAAYLAQSNKLRGAVMLSGPQDECIDCPDGTTFWIDSPYMTDKYTAFASGSEPFYDLMRENWDRITATGATSWEPGHVADVGYGFKKNFDVCTSPLVSYVMHAATSTCGGKAHCSTAIDDSVPFLEKYDGEKQYLYDIAVWPLVARKVKGC